jgi:hypothetical protein
MPILGLRSNKQETEIETERSKVTVLYDFAPLIHPIRARLPSWYVCLAHFVRDAGP